MVIRHATLTMFQNWEAFHPRYKSLFLWIHILQRLSRAEI